jgi:hypothetical protein
MKKICSLILFSFLSLLFSNSFYAQTITQTLTTSGSFVVPCGVTTLTVQCWGGGGGGGGGTTGSGNRNGGGGGGGGGYTINSAVSVTPGTYNYTVGATASGGAAGNAGTPGNPSIAIFGTTTITANGGGAGGGYVSAGGTAGAGGTGGTFNGGNGAPGVAGSNSGGGGEGAASNANGQNASTTNGGSITIGGDGGDGTSSGTTAGSNGSIVGGGGGGGTKGSTGGSGARGQIIISYATPATANAGPNQLLCNTNTFALSANLPAGFTGAWSCVTNCGTISFSNGSSATTNVSTVPTNTSVTVRWTLTHTSGCTLTDDAVITNSTSCPPVNDNCATATAFPAVPTDGSCASLNNQTTAAASNSGVTPSGACTSNSGTPDDDVWFSFVATSTTQILSATWISGNTDVYWQVFSGACGATMTSLLCTDTNTGGTLTGLTVGQTYYVRLYTWSSGVSTTQNICISSPPSPPANDNPCNATPVPVNSVFTCTTQTAGTIAAATSSGIALGSCFGTADDDVWFSFVANNSTQNININNITGSTTDLYHSVYAGSCGSLGAALICSDPNSSTVTGLTPGNTYYVRVYSWTSTTGQTSSFNICINPPPTPPTNDNACSATAAAVNAVYSCTTQTGGTVAGATASGVALGSCFGTPDDDVWYSFVANNSTQLISLNNVAGSTTDLYHSVYSGSCGSPGTALICSDANSSTLTGLTVGNTYFIRIYSYTSTTGQTSTFSLCISPPPTPPSNDNPCSATPAPVNATFTCSTQTGGTVVGATSSTVGLGACFGTADDDVWYSFVANNATQLISINNVAGSTTDLYHSVYSGNCGSIGAALVCSDPNNSTVTGLTVGNTYYIRIYSYTSTTGQTSTFSLCISPPPPPPANDNPCSATAAAVNTAPGTCTVQTSGTVAGATASGVALGACFGTADDDVWYSFVANGTSMNINLNNVSGSTTDLYHSVYSGSCGSPGAALICSDPNSSTISGLTIGNTYFIRIYSYTSTTGQTTTFDLCINPTPPPPTNVTCAQMQPICSGSPIVFQAQSGGGSAAPGPDYGCLSTTPNPTWFYLEIATPGSMAIDLTAGSDVDFAMWGPYSNLTDAQADCSSYPTPIDCSYSGSNVELMDIASVNVGEVYAVLVTNYANVVQSITLNQASGASATTNCAIVTLPVGLIYFDAKPNGNAIDITWETESEVNNDYFVIEKSSDAVNWETLIQKDGQGTSTVRTKYKHTDNKPYSDISYYRLKQVDFDLSHNYSNIVSVDLSKNNELISNVHPNPTNDVVYYDLTTTSKGDITVEVINYAGEVIYNNNQAVEFGKNSLNLSLQEFENGVYLIKIKIENSGKSLIQKIIKH